MSLREVIRTVGTTFGVDIRRPPAPLLRNTGAYLHPTLDHLIALRMLQDPEEPVFFIQIGAFDGRTGDQIHDYVVRYGWPGILVEPQPVVFEELCRTYAGQ